MELMDAIRRRRTVRDYDEKDVPVRGSPWWAAAVLDPETTSKLGLLVVGGSIVCLGGGFPAIRVLTKTRPLTVRVKKDGFEIDWDRSADDVCLFFWDTEG